MKTNWRQWNVGSKIKYSWNEFDGRGFFIGLIVKITDTYAIMETEDKVHLWIDDDTISHFHLLSK